MKQQQTAGQRARARRVLFRAIKHDLLRLADLALANIKILGGALLLGLGFYFLLMVVYVLG